MVYKLLPINIDEPDDTLCIDNYTRKTKYKDQTVEIITIHRECPYRIGKSHRGTRFAESLVEVCRVPC